MLNKSFKTTIQDIHNPWWISFPLNFENYKLAWSYVGPYIMNTVIIAGSISAGILIVASLAAYVFARFKFPGREFLFILILVLLMIPGILSLIPSFVLVRDLNLLDRRLGVILPGIATGLPFAIFLLRTFFAGLPGELFEAGQIDGISPIQAFVNIALPLSTPILSALLIMNILNSWNEIIWARIVLTSESMRTISVGLVPFTETYFAQTRSSGPALAGYVISSLPLVIVFFFVSKQFIRGMTSGAFKM